ncbi:MAG: cell division protein FtsQ [Pseudohongiellaceae bacterium]|jgi:cell division protein FtsQ
MDNRDSIASKSRLARKTKNLRVNTKRSFKKNRMSLSHFFYVVKSTGLLTIAMVAISVTGYYGVKTANNFLERPIKAVIIDGDFVYISRQSVKLLIDEHMKNSFIKEDLLSVRNKLMANPWIDSVSLRREWPDVLHVVIKEQRAIARWGDKGFLNYRGDLVLAKSDAVLNELPLLRSDDNQTQLLMRQYQFISELLSEHQLTILVLKKSTVGIWQAELNNGWKLFLGRADINKKIQHLLFALDQKAIVLGSDIDSIDLRYENGLSVQWIDSDDLGHTTVSAEEMRKRNATNI